MPYAPLATLALIAASLLVLSGEARAATVISHLGDANPTTEGWTESTSGSTVCGATPAIFASEHVWRVVDAPGGLTFDQYTYAVTSSDLSGAWWIRVRFAGNPLGTVVQDQVAVDLYTGSVRIQAALIDNGGPAEIWERVSGTTLFTGIANATTALHELVITGSGPAGDVQFRLDGGSPVTLGSGQQVADSQSPVIVWGARGGDASTGTGYWQAVAFGTGTPETLAATPAPTPGGAATLLASYSFEGDTHDATGLNDATNFGATFIADGIAGQALRFDGSDFVRAPDSPSLDIAGSLSLVAWVRTSSITGSEGMLVSKHHTHFNRSYDTYVLSSGVPFGEVFDTANNQYDATAGATVLDGLWHQVALTYDATSGTLTLYRDAVAVTSNAVGARTVMDSCVPLLVGAYGNSADGTSNRSFLTGDLDEVRVYRLALNAAQVAALYSSPALTRWIAGGSGGNWSTASNWDGGVPSASADVVMPGGAVSTLDGAAGGTIRSLGLEPGLTATITLQQSLSITGSLSLGGSTLTVSSSGGHSLSPATITGTGGITRSGGTDPLTLGGDNTYSGPTTVSTGLLQLGSATALGATSAGTIVQDGASISMGGAWTVNEPLSIQGTGAPGFGSALLGIGGAIWAGPLTLLGDTQVQVQNPGTTFTISGAISGGHGLTFRGFGDTGASIRTLVLSGANSYGGPTTLFQGGRLRLGAAGAVPDGSAVDVGSGVFDLNGFDETIGGLAGGGAVQLGTATVTVTVSQSADTTFSGVISGSGGLVKSGAGALVLSGPSTYTGSTAVNAGTLEVSGSLTGNGGAVTVGGGATLKGAGSIQRAVHVAAGGRISPGNSPGTLEAAEGTWGAGGVYEWEIDDALGAPGADPGWDLQRVSGALAIEATNERPFTISVRSLAGRAPGAAANFAGRDACAWPIATAAKGVSGFAEEKFRLDLGGFSDPGSGAFRIGLSGDGRSVLVRFSATPLAASRP